MEINESRKKLLHDYIKFKLKEAVEKDSRLIQIKMTEYTLQAIVWDHISRYVGEEWTCSIEDFIPSTAWKADVVIYKMTSSFKVDPRYGAVAIEVKPNGQVDGIKNDIKKLVKYTRLARSPVNYGIMIYMSKQSSLEKYLKTYLNKYNENEVRKIHLIRVQPPRK